MKKEKQYETVLVQKPIMVKSRNGNYYKKYNNYEEEVREVKKPFDATPYLSVWVLVIVLLVGYSFVGKYIHLL